MHLIRGLRISYPYLIKFHDFACFVHLIRGLSISYPHLIKFHDFADNSQEGMKHQIRGPAEQGTTLRTTLMRMKKWMKYEFDETLF